MSADINETIKASRKTYGKADANELALRVMDDLACPSPWREMFLPLLIEACAHTLRAGARGSEQRQPMPTPIKKADPVVLRDRFLAAHFMTGSKCVTWGEATVSDHEERMMMLAKLRDGLNSTIKRHQWAIGIINVKRVRCLADVKDLELPRDAAA